MKYPDPRRRRLITSLALGAWLFAFVVSVVHACDLANDLVGPLQVAASALDQDSAHEMLPGCAQFAAADLPLPAKAMANQGQADVQPSLLVHAGRSTVTSAATDVPLLARPRPSPRFPRFARFLRLTL